MEMGNSGVKAVNTTSESQTMTDSGDGKQRVNNPTDQIESMHAGVAQIETAVEQSISHSSQVTTAKESLTEKFQSEQITEIQPQEVDIAVELAKTNEKDYETQDAKHDAVISVDIAVDVSSADKERKDDVGVRSTVPNDEQSSVSGPESTFKSLLPEITQMSPSDGATNVSLRQSITFKLINRRNDQHIELKKVLPNGGREVVDGVIAEVDGATAFAPTLLLTPRTKFEATYSAGNMSHTIRFVTGSQCNLRFQIMDLNGNKAKVDVAFAENRSQWDDFVAIVCHHVGIRKTEMDKIIVTTADKKKMTLDSLICIRELVPTDVVSVQTKELVNAPLGDDSVASKSDEVSKDDDEPEQRSVFEQTEKSKDSYVNTKVAKRFSGIVYFGYVKEYLQPEEDDEDDQDLWRIEYEDGDTEDFDFNELQKGIALYEKEQKKRGSAKKTPRKTSLRTSSTKAPRDNTTTPVSTKRRAPHNESKSARKARRVKGKRLLVDGNETDEEGEAREYTVEAILDQRTVGGKDEYLVKWKNYDSSENTWEPLSNLTGCPKILADFQKSRLS